MRVSFVDVAYRGLKVAQKARWQEGEDGRAFLEHEAPLPVGARLQVTGAVEGETREAIVTGVVEQEAGAKSPPGMKLAWADAVPSAVIEADKTIPVEAAGVEMAEIELSGGIVVEEQGDEVSGKETAQPGGKRKKGKRKTQNGRVS